MLFCQQMIILQLEQGINLSINFLPFFFMLGALLQFSDFPIMIVELLIEKEVFFFIFAIL